MSEREDFEAWLNDKSEYFPTVDEALFAAYQAGRAQAVQAGWRPIAEAPKDGREMFVVRAFNVRLKGGGFPYTSDPYCVWRGDEDDGCGGFVRWPHKFPPTHFMLMPAAPSQQETP